MVGPLEVGVDALVGRQVLEIDVTIPVGRQVLEIDVIVAVGRQAPEIDVTIPVGRQVLEIDVTVPVGRQVLEVDVIVPVGRQVLEIDVTVPVGRQVLEVSLDALAGRRACYAPQRSSCIALPRLRRLSGLSGGQKGRGRLVSRDSGRDGATARVRECIHSQSCAGCAQQGAAQQWRGLPLVQGLKKTPHVWSAGGEG